MDKVYENGGYFFTRQFNRSEYGDSLAVLIAVWNGPFWF